MPEPILRLVCASDTHIGQREHNEDAILVRRELGLYVLADGAGGENAGNVASSLATSTIAHELEEHPLEEGFDPLGVPNGARRLSRAIHTANAQIVDLAESSKRFRGMGTTVVAVHVETDKGIMHVAHVGDSRLYRLRSGHVELLTEDHSLANDVLELAPEISEARARSLPGRVITRALGMAKRVRVSVRSFAMADKDRYLLCTDGLTDELDEEQLADALRQPVRPPALVKLLLDVADAPNAADNTAVIVLDVHEIDGRDWATPPLRQRNPRRTKSEREEPEIIIVQHNSDDPPSEVDEVDETVRKRFAPPQITSVPDQSATGLEAIQRIAAEHPSIGRDDRDPTIEFVRTCPRCGANFAGASGACPECWAD